MALRNRNQCSLSNVCGKFAVCLILWTNIIYSVSAQCSCYAYYGKLVKWNDGRALCQQENGDLVSMETLDEWEFIKNQIQKKATEPRGSNEWWIGLKYDISSKQWKWLSNDTLTYNNKWQPGKPSDLQYKHYTMIVKQYPDEPKYQGSFNNERSVIGRGYICEYKFTVGNQACKVNQKWCSRSITTTSRTTTQDRSPTTTSRTTTAQPPQTVTSTTAPMDANADPSSQPQKAKPVFPVYAIVIILVILFVVLVVLIVFLYRLKKKRDLKPRNSHLCKNSRVPVKLEHNSSTNNLNDKIIYADVVNLDGHKIQINCDSQGVKNTKRPGEVKPCNTETVVYANLRNENKNVDEMTADHSNRQSWNKRSDKVKLINEMEEEQKDETTTCLYEQVDQSKTADDNDNQKERLFYAQIGDFKDLADPTSPPPKKPEPYIETDYAVIVKP